jgi:hypothetical protein
MRSAILRGLAAAAVSAILIGGGMGAAQANGSYSLDLYISPPFVQGSAINDGGTLTENFDAFTPGVNGCNGTWGVGTATGDCKSQAVNGAGGATPGATDPTPTVGGAGSNYASTAWTGGTTLWAIDILLNAPVKYVGFWWSAGNSSNGSSYTNEVEFYSGTTLVATMTADDVMNIVGTQPSPFPGTATLTSDDTASTYTSGYYYGHPWKHASTAPTSPTGAADGSPTAPFVYLNLFVEGDFSIDRIFISGDGFEFDNMVTSTNPQTVAGNLVFAKNITVTAPPPPTTPPTAPPTDPSTPGANSGLPDTGLVWASFIGVALVGGLMFLAAGGAFRGRTRLHQVGIDVQVRKKLDALASSFERMDRLRRRRRK